MSEEQKEKKPLPPLDEDYTIYNRLLHALEDHEGGLLPAVQQLMHEAWTEGRDAQARDFVRVLDQINEVGAEQADFIESSVSPYGDL